MDEKWTKNEPKMTRNGTKVDPNYQKRIKMDQKWTANETKSWPKSPKLDLNGLWINQKCPKKCTFNGSKVDQKSSKIGPKIVQNRQKSVTKMEHNFEMRKNWPAWKYVMASAGVWEIAIGHFQFTSYHITGGARTLTINYGRNVTHNCDRNIAKRN